MTSDPAVQQLGGICPQCAGLGGRIRNRRRAGRPAAPITGPIPPDRRRTPDNYQGLGPGLPLNALGLPANDPLALVPLVDMGRTDRGQPDPDDGERAGVRAAAGSAAGGVADDGAAGSAAAEPATVDAAATAEPATVDAAAAAAEPATMDAAAAAAEPATMDAAAAAEPATMVMQPPPPQNLPPWMQPPPEQNCAVFCRYEPAPAGTAAAAAGGTAAGVVAPPAAPAEIHPPPAGRNSASATGRRAGDDACTACTAGSWTGARPGRPTGTAPAGESTHLTPPTLGGDVRASH